MYFAVGLLFCWVWGFFLWKVEEVCSMWEKEYKTECLISCSYKSWWKWNQRGFYINQWREKLMVDKGHKTLTSSDTRLIHLNLQLSLTFSCLDADTQFFNSFTWQLFPENLLCSKENVKMIGNIVYLLFWQIVSLEAVILLNSTFVQWAGSTSMKLGPHRAQTAQVGTVG